MNPRDDEYCGSFVLLPSHALHLLSEYNDRLGGVLIYEPFHLLLFSHSPLHFNRLGIGHLPQIFPFPHSLSLSPPKRYRREGLQERIGVFGDRWRHEAVVQALDRLAFESCIS